MKAKSDIIQKAADLIAQNAFVKYRGEWRFINEHLELSYRITRNSCECASFYYNNLGREYVKPCKHILMAAAPKVVLFIVKMRQCQTIDELMQLVSDAAPSLANELPEFIGLANTEYHLALGRLSNAPEQAAEPQQPKPAPKQKKYERKSVNRAGEQISMISQKTEPSAYNGISIT